MGRPYLVQRPLLDVAQDEIGNHSHIGKKGIFDYGGGGGIQIPKILITKYVNDPLVTHSKT